MERYVIRRDDDGDPVYLIWVDPDVPLEWGRPLQVDGKLNPNIVLLHSKQVAERTAERFSGVVVEYEGEV